jgi:hypothetical protein
MLAGISILYALLKCFKKAILSVSFNCTDEKSKFIAPHAVSMGKDLCSTLDYLDHKFIHV